MGEVTGKTWTDYSEPRVMAADLEAIEAAITAADAKAESAALVVNVRDFGAVGDGVTNDTDAFHAAINSLPEGVGGTIYVPNGVYIVAIQVRRPRTRIIGQGWGAILKTQPNATYLTTDCPLRILADECYVSDLATDGNRANNPALEGMQAARHADGIAIYANLCRVERVKTDDHQGHHLIVWNDPFGGSNGIPAAARYGNVIEDCYSTRRGLRNMLDFASTQDLGDDGEHDRNINHRNVFRGNFVDGGEIVIHTGWDTVVEGNTIMNGGGITVHTASRRVAVRGNHVHGGNITVRGGLDEYVTDVRRRSYDITVEDNTLDVSAPSAIYAAGIAGGSIRRNLVRHTGTSFSIRVDGTLNLALEDNDITATAGGIVVGIRDSGTPSSGLIVKGNRITQPNGGTRSIFISESPGTIIEGNTCHHARIEASAVDCTIRGNTISTAGVTAIVIPSSGAGGLVTGNRAAATGSTPVNVHSSSVTRGNMVNGVWVD